MPKGFSFVLVAVVMAAMMAFGLLSLSGAAADLRLARKAAGSQQDYYTLDRAGEKLAASCADAAARAGREADTLAARQDFARALPGDLSAAERSLTADYAAGRTADTIPARRALFFYYLEQNLKALPTGSCSWTLDANALTQAASGELPVGTAVLRLTADVRDSSVAGRSLRVELSCPYGGADEYPAFKKSRWQLEVTAETIDPDPVLPVWNGKG